MTEAGTTAFVSTHYMEEAEYCSRLALMNRGRLIALDQPANLKRSMEEPLFEVATDKPSKAVEALRVAPGILEAAMFGRVIHVMVEDAAAATRAIPQVLAAAGRQCHDIRRIAPSLEDVFVASVRREGGVVVG